MITEFVNRESELTALEKHYEKQGFHFYPIYGRRRIGKTELIKQFIKNKPHIYYVATEATEKENIQHFKTAASEFIDLSIVKDDFQDIFNYLSKQVKEKKLVIVIDEFPFLVKSNKAMSSIFQSIIDTYLQQTQVFLILCGSSLSMMWKEVLEYKAPLYGRRTGQIELQPLSFKHVIRFLQKPLEQCVQIYGVCGGVPLYLKEFTEKKNFFHLVKENVLADDAILNKEPFLLLREELDEISRYASILSAISMGNTKLGEIINYCGFHDRLNITPYLHTLERIGLIKKEISMTQGPRSRGIYKIKDNFFKFHFHFIRNYESIIQQNQEKIMQLIQQQYNQYLGAIYEDIGKELIISTYSPLQLGRWWRKQEEIDLVAINTEKTEIYFFECKWKHLSYNKTKMLLKTLEQKAIDVEWKNKKRKEYYGIIGKTIEKKEELKDEGYLVHDLEDWDKIKNI